MSTGGKGSALRPSQVSKEQFSSNWDAIFGKKKNPVEDVFFTATEKAIKEVGDIVIPKEGYILHCGSGVYGAAVVISVEPYVMVSESGDMRWSQQKADDYLVIGKAGDALLAICMRRLIK